VSDSDYIWVVQYSAKYKKFIYLDAAPAWAPVAALEIMRLLAALALKHYKKSCTIVHIIWFSLAQNGLPINQANRKISRVYCIIQIDVLNNYSMK
jgi:hypothetical protein